MTDTLSGKIKLVTAEYMPNRKAGQLAKSLRKIVNLYARGGLIVRLALMDKKFDKVKDLVGLLETNTTRRHHVRGKGSHGQHTEKTQVKCGQLERI